MIAQTCENLRKALEPGSLCAMTLDKLDSKRAKFLECLLVEGGNVVHASESADISRQSHYAWLASDSSYRMLANKITELLSEILEPVAIERAVHGWDEPVFHEGVVCGYKRKFDNQLLWKILQANKEKYRDVTGPAVAIQNNVHAGATPQEVAAEVMADPEYREWRRQQRLKEVE